MRKKSIYKTKRFLTFDEVTKFKMEAAARGQEFESISVYYQCGWYVVRYIPKESSCKSSK